MSVIYCGNLFYLLLKEWTGGLKRGKQVGKQVYWQFRWGNRVGKPLLSKELAKGSNLGVALPHHVPRLLPSHHSRLRGPVWYTLVFSIFKWTSNFILNVLTTYLNVKLYFKHSLGLNWNRNFKCEFRFCLGWNFKFWHVFKCWSTLIVFLPVLAMAHT